jgi:hypothetical protein
MGKSFITPVQHLPNQMHRLDLVDLHLVIVWMLIQHRLWQHGLKVMIGKGDRSDDFIKDMIKHKSVYLQAVGGAGALLAKKVKKSEVVLYPELGAEAIYRNRSRRFSCDCYL